MDYGLLQTPHHFINTNYIIELRDSMSGRVEVWFSSLTKQKIYRGQIKNRASATGGAVNNNDNKNDNDILNKKVMAKIQEKAKLKI